MSRFSLKKECQASLQEVIVEWRKFADSSQLAAPVCDTDSSSHLVVRKFHIFPPSVACTERKRKKKWNEIVTFNWKRRRDSSNTKRKRQQLNNVKLISPFPDGDRENQLEQLLNNPIIKLRSTTRHVLCHWSRRIEDSRQEERRVLVWMLWFALGRY